MASKLSILEAIKKHLVIHCETMDESNRVLMLLHDMGVRYKGGVSLEESYYSDYGNQTCYNLESIPLNNDMVIDNEWKRFGVTYQEKYYFTSAFENNRTVISSNLIIS